MDVRCTQCGANVTVASDVRLLACPFCGTALVIDSEGALFHETMRPTVGPGEVAAHLRRFLASGATVAGLDTAARLEEPELELFPFWAFTVAQAGAERTVLMPAAPSSLQGLQGLALPAGETLAMTPEVAPSATVREPEVPLATARTWLEQRTGEVRVLRVVLYHIPLYRIAYSWRGTTYRAAVDGVTGRVFPADFPAKAEAPYVLVAAMALVVFGLEGLVVSNLVAKALLYAVSAIPILGVAWWISRKV